MQNNSNQIKSKNKFTTDRSKKNALLAKQKIKIYENKNVRYEAFGAILPEYYILPEIAKKTSKATYKLHSGKIITIKEYSLPEPSYSLYDYKSLKIEIPMQVILPTGSRSAYLKVKNSNTLYPSIPLVMLANYPSVLDIAKNYARIRICELDVYRQTYPQFCSLNSAKVVFYADYTANSLSAFLDTDKCIPSWGKYDLTAPFTFREQYVPVIFNDWPSVIYDANSNSLDAQIDGNIWVTGFHLPLNNSSSEVILCDINIICVFLVANEKNE